MGFAMRVFALILMGAALAAPAFADDAAPGNAGFPATTAPSAQGEATSDDAYLDRVVCKKLPPPTGTMLGSRKVCHTEREWRDLQKQSQDRVNGMQIKNGGFGGPSG